MGAFLPNFNGLCIIFDADNREVKRDSIQSVLSADYFS